MYAEVIELLSRKGKFATEQALVVAEAIDMTIEKAQFVTVAILDARLAVVNGRIDAVWVELAKMDARLAKMEAKLDRWAVRMIVAMVVSQAALGPVGMSAIEGLRRALSVLH